MAKRVKVYEERGIDLSVWLALGVMAAVPVLLYFLSRPQEPELNLSAHA